MDFINIVEEDFLLIRHFFWGFEPRSQLGGCPLRYLKEKECVQQRDTLIMFKLHHFCKQDNVSGTQLDLNETALFFVLIAYFGLHLV